MIDLVPSSWTHMRRDWALLTAYQRFEELIGFELTFVNCRDRLRRNGLMVWFPKVPTLCSAEQT